MMLFHLDSTRIPAGIRSESVRMVRRIPPLAREGARARACSPAPESLHITTKHFTSRHYRLVTNPKIGTFRNASHRDATGIDPTC